jgi:hypothetical protein
MDQECRAPPRLQSSSVHVEVVGLRWFEFHERIDLHG